MAKIYRLPIIFFVVNNGYGMGLAADKGSAVGELYRKGCAYDMNSVRVDGNDVLAVRDAMRAAAKLAREEREPSLIEAVSFRFRGHSVIDPDRYRNREEVERGRAQDPIPAFAKRLLDAGLLDDAGLAQIEEQALQELDAAVKFAEESPFPPVEGLFDFIYAPDDAQVGGKIKRMAEITFRQALNETLREELQRDENVFLMGEEIGNFEGSYKITAGLMKEFGPRRVVDTPIAENGFVGMATGAAMLGLRPVVEIMTINFIIMAMDEIVNHAAKIYYMFGGQCPIPLVIRTPGGGGQQLSATHSQNLETWFAHVPGLKVVAPATPEDAKGLLRSVYSG